MVIASEGRAGKEAGQEAGEAVIVGGMHGWGNKTKNLLMRNWVLPLPYVVLFGSIEFNSVFCFDVVHLKTSVTGTSFLK
jgi:hypothetical protein